MNQETSGTAMPVLSVSADAARLAVEKIDSLTERSLLNDLIDNGLLIPTGVPGVYGRGADFESVVEAVDSLITHCGEDQNAEKLRFPPAMSRTDFERSDYMKSFPQLAGTVHSFCGNEHEHQQLLDCLNRGEDWTEQQKPTYVVMTPAACYPVYPVVARRGPLPLEGRFVDVFSYCFRHEPSLDPARMQLFRMREYVRFGTPEQILAFREDWMQRGQRLIEAMDLPMTIDLANDPFFGRGGKIVSHSQREQNLKFELLIPINSVDKPTACLSFNYHMDHFGELWDIRTSDGKVAHTGCVGFGMERITLSLFKHHGFNINAWPRGVRRVLWGK
ncbi:MAG: amino acid--[acyl-carrier-protein] ligase [Janthinobacterium lividum]